MFLEFFARVQPYAYAIRRGSGGPPGKCSNTFYAGCLIERTILILTCDLSRRFKFFLQLLTLMSFSCKGRRLTEEDKRVKIL